MDPCADISQSLVKQCQRSFPHFPLWMAVLPAAMALIVVALCWTLSIFWGAEWPTALSRSFFSSNAARHKRPPTILKVGGGSFRLAGCAARDGDASIYQVVAGDHRLPSTAISPQLTHILEPENIPGRYDGAALPLGGHEGCPCQTATDGDFD